MSIASTANLIVVFMTFLVSQNVYSRKLENFITLGAIIVLAVLSKNVRPLFSTVLLFLLVILSLKKDEKDKKEAQVERVCKVQSHPMVIDTPPCLLDI